MEIVYKKKLNSIQLNSLEKLDSVIVRGNKNTSFADRGLLWKKLRIIIFTKPRKTAMPLDLFTKLKKLTKNTGLYVQETQYLIWVAVQGLGFNMQAEK